MKIAVLGAGAWGTAISIVLSARHEVTLWARNPDLIGALRAHQSNDRYLPGFKLPPKLGLAENIGKALEGSELILAAVSTDGLRAVARAVRDLF